MPRRGPKVQASCWICTTCGAQTGQTFLNTANHGSKKLERRRFCQYDRAHTAQYTKPEKSGSLGLARNK